MASFSQKNPFLDCQKDRSCPQNEKKFLVVARFRPNLKPLMIVLLAVGVRRVAVPLARHQDREQQPVRARQHKPKGVQEGPKAGKKT